MPPSANWRRLSTRLAAARRKRLTTPSAAAATGLSLKELRQSRRISQVTLAHRLRARQPTVSKLERQGDMQVSSLYRYIHALGGRLELLARFPDGDIPLIQFSGE